MHRLDQIVQTLTIANVRTASQGKLNAFEFSMDGDFVIASCTDEEIALYDPLNGFKRHSIQSKKYGANLVQFAKENDKALHASTKENHDIRHLCLLNNMYERYFSGHTAPVVSLHVSPANESFLSASLDQTIRLWDLRSSDCQGLLNIGGRVVANYDPTGVVLAAGINSNCVELYDLRSFQKGPFKSFRYPNETHCEWTGLKFSPDALLLMIQTNGTFSRLINVSAGVPKGTPTGYVNNKLYPIEGCFSPDSRYIYVGSTNGVVHIWNIETGFKVAELNAPMYGPAQYVKFHPKYFMLVTGCINLIYWVPILPQALQDNIK